MDKVKVLIAEKNGIDLEYTAEINELVDFLISKGISFENNDNQFIDIDPVTFEMRFKDTVNGVHLMSEFLAGGGGGEANTGTNLGTGQGIYAGKSGVVLQFKSLKSLTNALTITSTANEIQFSMGKSADGGFANSVYLATQSIDGGNALG